MGESVEISGPDAPPPAPAGGLELQLLGPLALRRGGEAVALPSSRKVRALLAYLALAPRPVTRSHLCELLWDHPHDPRGELRWCLSKLRSVIDTPARSRVIADKAQVQLDLSDMAVDATAILRATSRGLASLDPPALQALLARYQGELLEGLELERSAAFAGWLTAQRRRFRSARTALLEALAQQLPDEDALPVLEQWLALAPFDRRAHERLLATLARSHRLTEGESHLAASIARFEAEGLDGRPLSLAWRAARAPQTGTTAPVLRPDPEGVAGRPALPRRASIAVMPFTDRAAPRGARGGLADALAHDVTTRLAKLRSLFVISQASLTALHERQIGPEDAGRMLDVDYMVSGSVQRDRGRLRVAVELAEARTARVLWSERLNVVREDAFLVLEEIGNRVVASIASEIETLERNRAILRPPASLDAWEAHHCGLWHMYRFTPQDNEKARQFFETAVRLDPSFSRAYAGLSFTHFQNAFQGWTPRAHEVDLAYAAAGQSLSVDNRDPAAHWALGRALWLRGSMDQAIEALDQSIELSPNFAQAHYSLAFIQAQAGNPQAALVSVDCSQQLSPFDPLLFAMNGARALALTRMGQLDEAVACAVKGASRPNAHPHVIAIAAYCLALADRMDEARRHAAAIRVLRPEYSVHDFLEAFRLDEAGAATFREGARRLGMA